MTTADGDVVEIVRPGFEMVVAADGTVSGPSRRSPGKAVQIAQALNPGLISSVAPVADADESNELEELRAEISGDLSGDPSPGSGVGTRGDTLGVSGGFGSDNITQAPNMTENQVSGNQSIALTLRQDSIVDADGNVVSDGTAPVRTPGLTARVIYTSDEKFSQSLTEQTTNNPQIDEQFIYGIISIDTDLGNYLILDKSTKFDVTGENFEGRIWMPLAFSNGTEFVEGLAKKKLNTTDFKDVLTGHTLFVVGAEGKNRAPTTSAMLQSGFIAADTSTPSGTSNRTPRVTAVWRKEDNFIVAEAIPALSSSAGREAMVSEYNAKGGDGDEGAARFLVSAFGVGFKPDGSGDFSFSLTDEDAITLAIGLRQALESTNPEDAVRLFLTGVEIEGEPLAQEEIKSAARQISRQEHLFFAAGDVDAAPDATRRLDVFFISPGLDGFGEDGNVPEGATVARPARAFLRNATAFRDPDGKGGIPLADTGLMIIGTPKNSRAAIVTDEQTGVLHADIGIDGAGADQRSTVSVTIGNVQYDVDVDRTDDFDEDEEVVLTGRTVGSTQSWGGEASTLAGGDVFNTAAGGGRAVDTDGDGDIDGNIEGRANYFVIENFNPEDEDGNRIGGDGGQERAMGGDDTNFAILRLATGTSSTETDKLPSEGGAFTGVAAGMLEQETDGEAVNLNPIESDFSMTLDPNTNRMSVDGLDLDGDEAEDNALKLGGLTGEDSKGESVYIDDHRFAARSDGKDSDVAFISGKVLRDAALNSETANDATKDFLNVPKYKHLKWGFFFGDTDSGGEDGKREHVHLGSWVAGNAILDRSRLPETGTATYSGHAFGNVFNNGALYAARGTYTNDWNFGSQTGNTDLTFDGANMKGKTGLIGDTAAFQGGLKGGGRDADINGVFAGEISGEAPKAQFGTFDVSDGKNYNAKGTFGAER